jgi:hypothetical protein
MSCDICKVYRVKVKAKVAMLLYLLAEQKLVFKAAVKVKAFVKVEAVVRVKAAVKVLRPLSKCQGRCQDVKAAVQVQGLCLGVKTALKMSEPLTCRRRAGCVGGVKGSEFGSEGCVRFRGCPKCI